MRKAKKATIFRGKRKRVSNDPIKRLLQGIFLGSLFFFSLSVVMVLYTFAPDVSSGALSTKLENGTLLNFPTITPKPHRLYPIKPAFADTTHSPVASDSPERSELSASTKASPAPSIPSPTVENDFCIDVPVLLYHHIEPLAQAQAEGHAQLTVDSVIFDEQMSYLTSHGYHTIPADQLVSAMLSRQQLPEKSVVVTWDDGYTDWYTYAYPIVKKYNVIANLMIPSGLIANPDYLTWVQLKEMSSSSNIRVYNHTWSHASLGDATREKIESEITTSQNQLQSQLGIKINIFTYPYGSFSPLAIQVLRENGFIAAFSTIGGTEQCNSFIMALHRTHIGNAPLSAYGF